MYFQQGKTTKSFVNLKSMIFILSMKSLGKRQNSYNIHIIWTAQFFKKNKNLTGELPQLDKQYLQKPMCNIHNCERPNDSSWGWEQDKTSIIIISLNVVLNALTITLRKEKELKSVLTRQEKNKTTSIFGWYDCLIEEPKESIKRKHNKNNNKNILFYFFSQKKHFRTNR